MIEPFDRPARDQLRVGMVVEYEKGKKILQGIITGPRGDSTGKLCLYGVCVMEDGSQVKGTRIIRIID